MYIHVAGNINPGSFEPRVSYLQLNLATVVEFIPQQCRARHSLFVCVLLYVFYMYIVVYHYSGNIGYWRKLNLVKGRLFAKFCHAKMNVGCNMSTASAETPKLYSPKQPFVAHLPKFCPSSFTHCTVFSQL